MKTFNKILVGAVVLFFIVSCGNEPVKEITDNDIAPAFDINQIDSSASPCEDFEKFAVGNWLKDNPVPESESRWGSFNVLKSENDVKLKTLVEDASNANSEKGSPVQQVGDFYKSAMDTNAIDNLGIQPIQHVLDQIENCDSYQCLIEQMTKNRRFGSGSFFWYSVGIDMKNSKEYVTYLSQGGLGLPDMAYYTPSDERGENIILEYEKHITKMLVLAGTEEGIAEESAAKIIEMETALASNSMTKAEARNREKIYNRKTKNELSKLCGAIDWNAFFSTAGLKDVEELVVKQPEYFAAFEETLNRFSLDDWKAYQRFHLLNDLSVGLSIEFEEQAFSFYKTTIKGVKQMKPRWKRTLELGNKVVGEQIGKLFVEKYFSQESKQMVLDLIMNISSVFKERVNELTWMGDSTKMKAIEKLSKFTYKIGYPDTWKDYSSVEIDANNFTKNVMNAREFKYNEMANRLGKSVDRVEWSITPQTINAYYNSTKNEIVFPAAILQPPFFNPDADDAINYGGIGAVIGHEFSHGFDDQGSRSDGDGNLKNWWTEDDLTNFRERTNKLVVQYDAFEVVEGNHVNGRLTLGENIADLAGLTLAYHALEKAMENKEDPMIDGFTYKQRYFLGWAQVWHANASDEKLINQVKTDYHSPTRYRIIGPMRNMVEFHEAFGCSNSNMVAPDSIRVSIW